MTTTWKIPEGEFANRLGLQDVSGILSKNLTVEQGTRALMFENGNLLGEVPAGTYTLQSFTERLKGLVAFWQAKKHVDVVLVRQEDVPLDLHIEKLPTSEYLLVDVDVRLVVQIEDVGMFAKNLLGSRQKLLLRGGRWAGTRKVEGQVAVGGQATLHGHVSLEGQAAIQGQASLKPSTTVQAILNRPAFKGEGSGSGEIQASLKGKDSLEVQTSLGWAGSHEHSHEHTASLADTVSMVISQSLRETVRRLSIESLFSPEVRDHLVVGVREAVQSSLRRYGIVCTDIQVAKIVNPEYDKQLQKTGEIVLYDLQIQQQEKEYEVQTRAKLQDIQQRERTNELNVLAENVEIDREEFDIALLLRRNQVKKDLRDAVMSDKFDLLTSDEEFATFRQQIDKQRMLREDEHDELAKLFEAKKDDRQSAREFLMRKLEFDRNAELDQLKASIEHAQNMKAIRYAIELAGVQEDEAARQWRKTLEIQAEKSEHDFQEMMKVAQRQHDLNVKKLTFLNADEWDELLHTQKIKRQEKEFEEEQAAAEIRKTRINDEYELERKRHEHAFNKDVMDDEDARRQKRREERRKDEDRAAESVLAAQAQKHQQEVEILKTRATMSTEALIATADEKSAQALADVEKSKNESAAQSTLRDEAARRERELQDQRVLDAQKNNETTLAAIQAITGQAFGAIGQGAGRPATPMPGYGGSTDPTTLRVIVCGGCKAENPPTARFCSNCGKEL